MHRNQAKTGTNARENLSVRSDQVAAGFDADDHSVMISKYHLCAAEV